MSVTVLRFLLVLGIIGHAVNMYCDRIISIFPNGRLKIEDIKTIGEEGKMAKLMEGGRIRESTDAFRSLGRLFAGAADFYRDVSVSNHRNTAYRGDGYDAGVDLSCIAFGHRESTEKPRNPLPF